MASIMRRRPGCRLPLPLLNCEKIGQHGAAECPFANGDCHSLGQRYEVLEALGSGSTAVVYRARRRADGAEVALKVTRMRDVELLRICREEFSILHDLQHPNIIRCIEHFTYPDGLVLVLDYVAGQSLGAAVRASPQKRFHEEECLRLFRALMKAVAYIHEHCIIHRDISSTNVLVEAGLRDLKLVDFNVAFNVLKGGSLTPTGTADFMSPEVLMGHSHTTASDVWAAGLCLHLMSTGRLIASASFESSEDFTRAVVSQYASPFTGPRWVHLTLQCISTLQLCLTPNWEKRPSAAEILNSEWLVD